MNRLVYCLPAVLLALSLATPLSAAPDRFEKQEAAVWVKEESARLKKTLALLKRVKDEKSAEKAGKALLALYKVDRKQTAMGEVAPPQKPTGEAMVTAEGRNAERFNKMQKAIQDQLLRIGTLELDSPSLDRALEAVEAATGGNALSEDDEASPSSEEP